MKADPPAGRLLRIHQLADGREQDLDALIVRVEPALQLGKLVSQLLVSAQHFPELNKGPDHVDAGLDGARAVKDIGRHDRAVLGEGIRRIASPAAPGV